LKFRQGKICAKSEEDKPQPTFQEIMEY